MSWQPDYSTLNEDGEYQLMWVEDGEGSKNTTGSDPTPITQDQYDQAMAEGLGMTLEQYRAVSGTGYVSTPENQNQTDDNQSQAETNRLNNMNKDPVTYGLGNISPGSDVSTYVNTSTPGGSTGGGALDSVLKRLGILDQNGNINLQKALAGLGGALTLADGLTNKAPQPIKSIAELRAGMPATNTPNFTPEQIAMMTRPMQSGTNLQTIGASQLPNAMVPGVSTRKYADGGMVEPAGALTQAFAGAVTGSDGGQSDLVDAKLSPGEYVLDAETVSALGDGNTAAGVAKLDELRRQLREQKRSAPNGEIPPPAKGPLSYMGGQ